MNEGTHFLMFLLHQLLQSSYSSVNLGSKNISELGEDFSHLAKGAVQGSVKQNWGLKITCQATKIQNTFFEVSGMHFPQSLSYNPWPLESQ